MVLLDRSQVEAHYEALEKVESDRAGIVLAYTRVPMLGTPVPKSEVGPVLTWPQVEAESGQLGQLKKNQHVQRLVNQPAEMSDQPLVEKEVVQTCHITIPEPDIPEVLPVIVAARLSTSEEEEGEGVKEEEAKETSDEALRE